MNSHQFLTRVLPYEGVFFLAQPYQTRDGRVSFKHHVFDQHDAILQSLERFNRHGETIYYAMASFREVIYKTSEGGFTYPTGRTQANAYRVKSVWQDIDVGKATVPSYSSQREATKALGSACSNIGIPLPVIVSSGIGLHVYWVFPDAITVTEWKTTAKLMRDCLTHAGLKLDTSRSVDVASILRPVGAKRMVSGKERVVRILRDTPDAMLDDINEALTAYTMKHGLLPVPKKTPASTSPMLNGLTRQKVSSALALIDPNEYSSWLKVCSCCSALRDVIGADIALALWLEFSDSADEAAKAKNDSAGTNPETMFDTMRVDMGADVALATLMSMAKETSLKIVSDDIRAENLTERGNRAVVHLTRFHAAAMKQLLNDIEVTK